MKNFSACFSQSSLVLFFTKSTFVLVLEKVLQKIIFALRCFSKSTLVLFLEKVPQYFFLAKVAQLFFLVKNFSFFLAKDRSFLLFLTKITFVLFSKSTFFRQITQHQFVLAKFLQKKYFSTYLTRVLQCLVQQQFTFNF